MKLRKVKKILFSLLTSGILALEVCLLADALAVYLEMRLTPLIFAAAVCIFTLVFALLPKFTSRKKLIVSGVVLAAAAAICAVSFGLWFAFQKNAPYMDVDSGKKKLYADHSVMVIVPHQDDECNILGGVLEEFTNYGSEITVVYTTNGDMEVPADSRIEDAIRYCASVGIPAENVIFLGYGDQWQDPQPDIYNAQPEAVLTSNFGTSETYGSENHKPWQEGRAYTRRNICEDIRSVILAKTPDMIFCIDVDDHIGHISTSLLFEEVMGDILKEVPQYRPVVLKGFAYGTAWFAQNDYFRLNMLATGNLFDAPYYQEPAIYRWDDRVRFPVDAAILSRSAVNSGGYEKLKLFASQTTARESTPQIINGDKVFWQRRTDSLCYDAKITVSTGEAACLTDFKLLDSRDLKYGEDLYDGAWVPGPGDEQKQVLCELPQPMYVDTIVLYDNPHYEDNVLDARIAFDDGTTVNTGPLQARGAATEIYVGKENVSSFTVTLLEAEGEMAGLTELEAYSVRQYNGISFVKLMDAEGNFAYDYCLKAGDNVEFSVYTYGDAPGLESGSYAVTSSNPEVAVTVSDGRVQVLCPRGETAVITLSCEEAQVSDSIYVQNPGSAKVLFLDIGQRIENFARFRFRSLMGYWFTARFLAKLGIGL